MHETNRLKFEFMHQGRRRGAALKLKGGSSHAMKLSYKLEPLDFFNLMIADEFRWNAMLKHTNQRVGIEGAGDSLCADWRPFSIDKVNAFIGLLLANGVSPKPNVGLQFASGNESKIFTDNIFKQGVVLKLCQHCQCKEHLSNPEAGKKIPDA